MDRSLIIKVNLSLYGGCHAESYAGVLSQLYTVGILGRIQLLLFELYAFLSSLCFHDFIHYLLNLLFVQKFELEFFESRTLMPEQVLKRVQGLQWSCIITRFVTLIIPISSLESHIILHLS